MKRLVLTTVLILTALSLVLTSCASTTAAPSATQAPKLDNLRLVGTIGPLSIPLAYMVDNNSLASVAAKTSLSVWANPTQLQAVVAGGQGDFVELPTNSAATFFNKGVAVQLLDASIWNILYLITADTSIKSVADLKSKRVVVPYQGAIPDAMFRFVCQKQGLNPDNDISVIYAPDPVQGSQMLLTGREKYVLLSEPSATSVILQGKASGQTYLRVLNMETEWQKASGSKLSTPIAGTIATGSIANRPDIINTFNTEYQKAIKWMLANPVEAGKVGAKVLAEQGFTAQVLTESMQNITWRFVSAQNARPDIEAFFNALAQVSPNYIGGKLPENGFYFGR